MQIVLLRSGPCGNGRTCPNLNRSDRATYVIQGYVAEATPETTPGQVVVEVPVSLLPELVTRQRDNLHLTDHGTILISGAQLTDPQALDELNLPAGENAIEVPAAAFPELGALEAPC